MDNTKDDRYKALDEAVLAHREHGTADTRATVLAAAEAYQLARMNEYTVDYQARTRG